jgi:hypothetical protein
VAASYAPTQTLFLQNIDGKLDAVRLATESTKTIKPNSIRKLYLQKREAFYGAILGPGVLVPEGEFDHDWLRLLQQLAECTEDKNGVLLNVAPISIVPTQNSVVETYAEVVRLRPDAVPFVDGDSDGGKYLASLSKSAVLPRAAIQMGSGAAIECLAAWVLEPALKNPGDRLGALLTDVGLRDLKALQKSLCDGTNKKDRELRETLVWEALDTPDCGIRAATFFNDVATIINGDEPTGDGWQKKVCDNGLKTWVASHIQKK